jgi:hypothetical protein
MTRAILRPDAAMSIRYVWIETRRREGWARQLGASPCGRVVVFALVDAAGRDLGQILVARSGELRLDPAVRRPRGLELAGRSCR